MIGIITNANPFSNVYLRTASGLSTCYTLSQSTFLGFLATLCYLWDLSSLTRDQVHAPCTGNMESQPLDHKGLPSSSLIFKDCFISM